MTCNRKSVVNTHEEITIVLLYSSSFNIHVLSSESIIARGASWARHFCNNAYLHVYMSHLGNVGAAKEDSTNVIFFFSLVPQTSVVYQLQRRVRTLREQLQRRDLHLDLLRRKLSLQEDSVRMKSLLQSERDEANIRYCFGIARGRLRQNFDQIYWIVYKNVII